MTLTQTQSYRLPVDLIDRLDEVSISTDIPRVALMRRSLTEFLDRHYPKPTTDAENAPS